MAKVDFNGEGQELERITAKKNYASSMQSHKMGSCAMFNELHKYMGENFYPDLINEVDGNYAVEQYPVLAFQDVKLEGTSDYEQRYIGLYTVGADKGDKGYFGFKDPRVKDKAIRLEGTDHIKGVGFNYPWRVNGVRSIRYNHDKEALCIVTGEDKTKWTAILEQSYCGTAETEAEIEAYLEEKFMPIYELAYNNNPLLVGTSMSIDTINADVDAFGSLRRTDGRPYSYCEFWIDGEYDVYYLNQERNRYEKNGLNLYNVLSNEDKARVDAASTLDEKNEIFIKHRVNAFKEVAENYICIDDALFLIVFCLVVVASDNFEKNMYPYIMDFLLRFFNDDLDSIFSTDNQAQDTKKYSAELHDFTDDTMSAYVFKGEDNALFNLIEMAYPERLMKMGKDMLQSMYDLSKKGTKTLDRLNGYYDQTFFDKAQNYYPISAYNNDSEVSYLEAWNDKDYVASVDIHPLAQSLGNHYTTEKRFVNLRNVYLMSKFGFGGFASYEDNSLGVISVRTQKPVGFTLTPAIDMYPTILGGQAQVSKSDRRIKAGESVTLAAVGGGNTNVYIVAADYLIDIGDLKDLSIDPSSDVSLNVSSKRLRWLKLGDEDAAAVTSYLAGVNIQKCDSLETIDARNLVSLKGDVDLANCPRLYAALFKGTSTKKVNVPVGSKIEVLSLPDTITNLTLVKLPNLAVMSYKEYEADLEYKQRYYATNQGVGNKCTYAVTSDTNVAGGLVIDLTDVNSIIITGKGGNTPRLWCFIDANDIIVSCAESQASATNLSLTIPRNAVKCIVQFMASASYKVVISKGDIGGFTYDGLSSLAYLRVENNKKIDGWDIMKTAQQDSNQLTHIRVIGFDKVGDASDVTLLKTLSEGKYHGIDAEGNNADTSLPIIEGKLHITGSVNGKDRDAFKISFPNLIFNADKFVNFIEFADKEVLRVLLANGVGADGGITEEQAAAVTSIGTWFKGNTTIKYFDEFDKFTNAQSIPASAFEGDTKLERINLIKVTSLGNKSFYECTSLAIEYLNLPNLKTLGQNAFYGVKIKKISNLGKITALPDATSYTQNFGDKSVLEEVIMPDTLTTISSYSFMNYTKLSNVDFGRVTTIGYSAFRYCSNLKIELSLPYLTGTLGGLAFGNTGITKVLNLGTLEYFENNANVVVGCFYQCTSLTEVLLPDTIKGIGNECFYGCTNLMSINLPNSITSISRSGFAECTSLVIEDLNLPNLETIGSRAFRHTKVKQVTNLGRLSILTGENNTEAGCFGGCYELTKVILPDTLTKIGANAFAGDKNLETVICNSTTPPTLDGNSFNSTHANLVIYVPDVSVTAYREASVWVDYADRIKPLSEYTE